MKLLLLSMFFSATALGETLSERHDLSFTFFGNEGRNRVFLSCDYARNRVTEVFNALNAKDLEVTCSGGIDFGAWLPISIKASYNPHSLTSALIESDFRTNCFFDTRFINYLVKKEPHLKVTSSRTHCWQSSSQYSYDIEYVPAHD